MILAEIKWNLSPLKVFYFLIANIKSKHKLTDLNYNLLAILSRIVLIVISDYGSQIIASIAEGFVILIAVKSKKFIGFSFKINEWTFDWPNINFCLI